MIGDRCSPQAAAFSDRENFDRVLTLSGQSDPRPPRGDLMSKSAAKPPNEATKEYEAWYEEQVRLGLDDLDAGRIVASEDAEKHFERTLKQLERKHGTKAA